MVFESILNPIFAPLLKLPILFAVVIISFIISIVIVLAYRFFTDQKEMKALKDRIKEFQTKMKANKDKPEKVMALQKQSMEINMKYMMKSMKPTLFTFLPIIIIFGWLNAHLAFAPIMPGAEFTTSAIVEEGITGDMTIVTPAGVEVIGESTQAITGNAARWTLKGDPGTHLISYQIEDKEYTREVLITSVQEYSPPVYPIDNSKVKSLNIENPKLEVLNLFGWKLGWLGTYIIFSLIFSMSLRKLLKIY